MIITTKITFKEYVRLMFILTYRKPLTAFVTFLGVYSLAAIVLFYSGYDSYFNEPSMIQIMLMIVLLVLIPFSVYYNAKKLFASQARIQEEIIYEFTDDKIKLTGESFNVEQTWEKTYKVVELKSWVLIYQSKLVANIIPKKAFDDKLEEFRSLVRSKTFLQQKLRS